MNARKNCLPGEEMTMAGIKESFTIKELFKGTECKIFGEKTIPVLRITDDSRQVIPGSLFFAVEGTQHKGVDFVSEAIGRGAVGVVTAKPLSGFSPAVKIVAENVPRVMAEVARRFYKLPDERLELIGVTGTNGKTTVTMLAQYLLSEQKGDVGLIGTVKYDLGKRAMASRRTTPMIIHTCGMLDEMAKSGCKKALMEVSSHGIDQQRVSRLHFAIGAFLNLTPEHLDYHEDMESYYRAKRLFFMAEGGSTMRKAIISIDDPYGKRLADEVTQEGRIEILTTGINTACDIRAEGITYTSEGSEFTLCWPTGKTIVKSPLLGKYNVYNLVNAMAIGWANGCDMETMARKVATFLGVPGRMQRVEAGQEFQVIVDYAHKEEALVNVLQEFRKIITGKLVVVFGCGGNRDRQKRPKMTAAVQEYADFGWATSDNPRKESVEVIFEDMRAGVTKPDLIAFERDRKEAIRKAIENARKGDCILIAGKGHETYQEFADTIVPFDDVQVAKEVLNHLLLARS